MYKPDHNFQKLIQDLQAVEFALVEIRLYLDTHPYDHRAIQDYNYLSQQLHCLKHEYDSNYGPLLQYGFSPETQPSWIDSPWPWEIEYGHGHQHMTPMYREEA